MRGASYLGGGMKPVDANPYRGTRQDGVRRHDQNWSDLYASIDDRDEFRAITGIASAVLMGAAVWAALACFVVILWGVMS
jgi:hypothetical protein